MIKLRLLVFAVCTLIVGASELNAQTTARDRKAIRKVKHLDVSRLDKRLSHITFSDWFRRTVGPSQKVEWEVNDCGEQDGSGRQKDFPICVEAKTKVDQIDVGVQIAVGTYKKGLIGSPVVWGVWVYPSGQESKVFDTLSDLKVELSRLKRSSLRGN